MYSFGYPRRLHYPWQYRRFFAKTEVFRLSLCTVFRVPNDLGHFRVGISLKARGTSLERNRTKRQIRENFRALGSALGSFDYNVVIAGHRKMAHPFPRLLGKAIQQELPKFLKST